MSTAAQFDQPYDDGEDRRLPDFDPYCDEQYPACCHDRDCSCGGGEPPPPMSDPGLGELLEGPAADAMFGLGIIRDVPAGQVPPAVMVQAVLGAQRLISWARAQQHRWTAALARPDVAVPVTDLLDSLAHRNDEHGRANDIPEELAERAAAGTEVIGDDIWDALLAAEAASMAEPELSAAWLVAPITARRRIADAQELVDELPDTFAALEDGRIEDIRARIIAETTAVLDPDLRRRAERLILDRAKKGMCPGDLRRLASKVVADIDPEAAAKRAEQARARRGTTIRNLDDDMGRFTADLAVEDAALTQAVLDLLAKAIPPEARQGRGISQLRADIFADLFGELADTGLIDLRGINPNNADHAGTDSTDAGADRPDPNVESDPTQPTGSDCDDPTAAATDTDATDDNVDQDTATAEPSQDDTDTDNTDSSPSDPDIDQDVAADTVEPNPDDLSGPDDLGDPAAPEPAQPATPEGEAETSTIPTDSGGTGQPLRDESAEAEPTQSDPVEADTGSGSSGSTPGESTPDNQSAPDTDHAAAGPPPPTAAELLARLRSIDWQSRLDPNCERRGGLLSMVRLPAGVRVNLDVTVALSTLAGYDDLSARLAGLGVITADTARALAKAAGTVRILLTNDPAGGSPPGGSPPSDGRLPVDPVDPDRPTAQHHGGIHHDSPDCGTVLDFGRAVYRPPATVIDRVDTRDQRCRFPGCPQLAERSDHDHRITWDDGGATCPCDLDALCRFHHRSKTFTAWSAIRDQRNNTLTWTSPLGRTHVDRPAPDLPTGTPMNLAIRANPDRPNLSDPPEAERVDDNAPVAGAQCPSDDDTTESEIGSVDSDLPPF